MSIQIALILVYCYHVGFANAAGRTVLNGTVNRSQNDPGRMMITPDEPVQSFTLLQDQIEKNITFPAPKPERIAVGFKLQDYPLCMSKLAAVNQNVYIVITYGRNCHLYVQASDNVNYFTDRSNTGLLKWSTVSGEMDYQLILDVNGTLTLTDSHRRIPLNITSCPLGFGSDITRGHKFTIKVSYSFSTNDRNTSAVTTAYNSGQQRRSVSSSTAAAIIAKLTKATTAPSTKTAKLYRAPLRDNVAPADNAAPLPSVRSVGQVTIGPKAAAKAVDLTTTSVFNVNLKPVADDNRNADDFEINLKPMTISKNDNRRSNSARNSTIVPPLLHATKPDGKIVRPIETNVNLLEPPSDVVNTVIGYLDWLLEQDNNKKQDEAKERSPRAAPTDQPPQECRLTVSVGEPWRQSSSRIGYLFAAIGLSSVFVAIGVLSAYYHVKVVARRLEAEERCGMPTSTPCEPSSRNGARTNGPMSTDRNAPTSTDRAAPTSTEQMEQRN